MSENNLSIIIKQLLEDSYKYNEPWLNVNPWQELYL